MRRSVFYTSLLCILCCCLRAAGQHPYYYTINDDNGLPSNEVYQLQQDDFGYMWIGCNSGLFRYDGFNFRPYKNEKQNSIAISGLTMAAGKRLHAQNFSGQLFYIENDSLVLYADVKDKIRAHPAYSVDKAGNTWIGLPEGLLKQDASGKQTLFFSGQLWAIEVEACDDGTLYLADASKGLLKISPAGNGQYTWKNIPGATSPFINSETIIEKTGNRFFTLSSNNSDRKYFITEIRNDSAILFKEIPKNTLAEFIYSLTLIGNKLWLGTSSGAYCLNFDGQVEKNYFHEEKISDILCDREGSYWFSSLQNGIFIVPDMDLLVINTGNSELKDDHITTLKAISTDELLIGTYSGNIYRYSLSTRQVLLLPKSRNAIYRNVTSIISYDKNTVIAARGGVSVIDLPAGTDHSYSSVYIRNMVQVGDSIVFASSAMIGRINDLAHLVKNHKFRATSIKNIPGKHICYDSTSGSFWLTLNNGLATLQHNECIQFTVDNHPLYCNALYADKNGLWAGTVSDGVYNIRNKKMVLHLDNTGGLKGNNVRSVISVHDTLYIATDACVNIYYPNGKFAYLDYTDGVNAKEITSLCIAGGCLFIGTIRGLFQIPLNAAITNHVPPNISISSVFINGRIQPTGKPLELPWNSTDILINFSSVALRSRGKFSYMYRIKGFRDEWEKLDGNINYVRLNHLPPGNFTFEVRSVNEDGIPSQSTAAIAISSEAPFWQQWWFYVLITILGSSFVALLFLLRIKKIQRAANIRNQVAASQLTALKAQMNPHFMYNTLNSIQDLILQNDIKNTNYYLSRYSTLMRKILESSDSNEIDLSEEIEILQLYMELEKLRFGNDFTFSITVPQDVDTNNIRIPSMIIQPFVENAIKHGLLHKKGDKKLQIIFERIGNGLLCTIKDNGIGREKAAGIKARAPLAPRSFALKATERRLELVNMGRKHKIILKIIDNHDNGIALGTEVQILIPDKDA